MKRFRFGLILMLMAVMAGGCSRLGIFSAPTYYTDSSGLKLLTRTSGEKLEIYQDGTWKDFYWIGVDLGNTVPGHFPGEMAAGYTEYRRWFTGMEKLGVKLVRIYTILNPDFYLALHDHNKSASSKLLLVQGIWPPEEKLLEENNAFKQDIVQDFDDEISRAVQAVYGRGDIPARRGHASGKYKTDVSEYLFAWMLGCEWDPSMVKQTNQKNPSIPAYTGKYFTSPSPANPFETWLAGRCDHLAAQESKQGWQHPISFVNWPTTDPLSHPNEPRPFEDMVSIDPANIKPTAEWKAGYFASFHIYPYYPDFMNYDKSYQDYKNHEGQVDPYEGYIVDLKNHLKGVPLVVSEFGVPSSRGMAHRGPLNRNQGFHREQEQGEMLVSMIKAIKNAGCAGAVIFAWTDEWFKLTWNTMDLEIPADRRPLWFNPLTNEQNFGLLASEAGKVGRIHLDGSIQEWQGLSGVKEYQLNGQRCCVYSDEAYIYILLENEQAWNWEWEHLLIGFDNQYGGNKGMAGRSFNFQNGAEFVLEVSGPRQAVLKVASSYDPYTYHYGYRLRYFSWDENWSKEDNGLFLPWRLALNGPMVLPRSGEKVAMQDFEAGRLQFGISDPASPDFDNLADFYTGAKHMEIRIPWTMLGFTDPSSHRAWSHHYRSENLNQSPFSTTTSEGLRLEVLVLDPEGQVLKQSPGLDYNWPNWDEPAYHERYKKSYSILQNYLSSQAH